MENRNQQFQTIADAPSLEVKGVYRIQKEFIVYALFFFSGFSALIYEVAWLNRIQLIMGHTIYALSTLLGAYLGGLALGSFFSHRIAKTKINPLSFYLIFELLIGIYGLCFFPILNFTHSLYSPIVSAWNLPLPILSLIQFIFCGLVIFFPTTLMGATLPLLAEFLHRENKELGKKLPRLYGVNTLGAFFGCLCAGYLILPLIGYQRSIYLCSLINVGLFCFASVIFQDLPTLSLKETWSTLKSLFSLSYAKTITERPTFEDKSINALLLISGLCSIFLQLLWNRMAALSFGPSVYIFPLITGVVLLGIFLGSFVISKLSQDKQILRSALLIILILTGLTLSFGNFLYSKTPLMVFYWHQKFEPNFLLYSILCFSWTCLCLLPGSMCLGSLFPLSLSLQMKTKKDEEEVSRKIGWGFGLNILGILLGSLMGAFIILPHLGIDALNQLTLIGIFLITAVLAWSFGRGIHLVVSLFILLVTVLLVFPPFDRVLLTSGYFYNRSGKKNEELFKKSYLSLTSYHNFNKEKLIEYKDDAHGTISIHGHWANSANIFFKINGKVDGNNNKASGDVATVRLISLLPLLFRTDYENILTVGLGTGESANLTHNFPKMKESTVVELSPSIVEFSQKYFFFESQFIWEDPRFKVLIRDGREYLLHTKKKFDLIISEPSNPWVDGVSGLFTEEYFQLISKKLNKQGIASIWFHQYGLECDAIDSVIMAAARTFKHIKIFKESTNIYVIGSNNLPLIIRRFPKGLETLEDQLFRIFNLGYDLTKNPAATYRVLDQYLLANNSKALQGYDNFPLINNDDNQFLQFKSGRSFWTGVSCSVKY